MSVLDGPGEGTWSAFALQVVEQRDALEEQLEQMTRERDEARASVSDAYRQGAEDMRLACQEWCRAWENNGNAIADALACLGLEVKL